MSARRDPQRRPTALPLPPYSAAVLESLRAKRPLNTFIMAGPDAWNRHKRRVDRVVLPPDASPDDFDWRLFRGQSPTVIGDDAEQARLKRLAWLLLRAGAELVCVIFDEAGITRTVFLR